MASLGVFFSTIISSLVDFFEDVGLWVYNAGRTAANWLSGAAKSIANFFDSIF